MSKLDGMALVPLAVLQQVADFIGYHVARKDSGQMLETFQRAATDGAGALREIEEQLRVRDTTIEGLQREVRNLRGAAEPAKT